MPARETIKYPGMIVTNGLLVRTNEVSIQGFL